MNAERYHRQLILKGFNSESQQRLTDANVLVVGAGGLGCPALQYLTAVGVGHIGIIDYDVVALSNLHRQILFGTKDIGKLKVIAAEERLKALNPDIQFTRYPYKIQKFNILSLLAQYDYILDATDNFQSRYLISDACMLLNKPLVFAAVAGYEGQLAIFGVSDDQGKKTNYRDLFPIPPSKGEIPNCEENGVLGVLPGIIGAMQAAEVIKLITGIGKPLINKILSYDLLTQQFYEINITQAPANTYQLPNTEIEFLKMHHTDNHLEKELIEIDTLTLENLKASHALIIDVREIGESPSLNPDIYKQVPMSEFADFLNQEIAQDEIVLICQHGIRSVAAAEQLQEKYGNTKKIYSLKGGIARYQAFFSNQQA